MGKKTEDEPKKKLKRAIAKEERNRQNKKKPNLKKVKNQKKRKVKMNILKKMKMKTKNHMRISFYQDKNFPPLQQEMPPEHFMKVY